MITLSHMLTAAFSPHPPAFEADDSVVALSFCTSTALGEIRNLLKHVGGSQFEAESIRL